MKHFPFLLLILIFSQAATAFAQADFNKYEAEILLNPNKGGKDTREVNAVLIFEKDSVKVISRRKKDLPYKDFNYKDIKYVEHSFSKTPIMSAATKSVVFALMTGLPLFYSQNEKHWLTIVTENDFLVLKIENDNFRLIKNEFMIRKLDLVNINENRE